MAANGAGWSARSFTCGRCPGPSAIATRAAECMVALVVRSAQDDGAMALMRRDRSAGHPPAGGDRPMLPRLPRRRRGLSDGARCPLLAARRGTSTRACGCAPRDRGRGPPMAAATPSMPGTLVLFDVDGTLTLPRRPIAPDMLSLLQRLRRRCRVGIVGGSDLAKIAEQIGSGTGAARAPRGRAATAGRRAPAAVVQLFDYVFSENGLVAYRDGQLIGREVHAAAAAAPARNSDTRRCARACART